MGGSMGESHSLYGAMAIAMNICDAHGSEHVYIATKLHSVMNLATKCLATVGEAMMNHRHAHNKMDVQTRLKGQAGIPELTLIRRKKD